jgi:hypothetical protein
VRPRPVQGVPDHQDSFDLRIERGDVSNDLLWQSRIGRRRFTTNAWMVEASHFAKAVVVPFQLAPRGIRHGVKVALEIGKTKTPVVGRAQRAEVVKLLFFGQENFRMTLEVMKKPRCPGPLRSENKEIGKVAQIGVRVSDAHGAKLCPKIAR